MLAEPALDRGGLFTPARDNWPFENVLQQLGWAWTLGREGGLFLAIGRMRGGRTWAGARTLRGSRRRARAVHTMRGLTLPSPPGGAEAL